MYKFSRQLLRDHSLQAVVRSLTIVPSRADTLVPTRFTFEQLNPTINWLIARSGVKRTEQDWIQNHLRQNQNSEVLLTLMIPWLEQLQSLNLTLQPMIVRYLHRAMGYPTRQEGTPKPFAQLRKFSSPSPEVNRRPHLNKGGLALLFGIPTLKVITGALPGPGSDKDLKSMISQHVISSVESFDLSRFDRLPRLTKSIV